MTEYPSRPATSRPIARRSVDERDPLMQPEHDGTEADGATAGEPLNERETKPLAGGTILGIHNLAIVMPQFIVCIIPISHLIAHPMSRPPQIALVASFIFHIVDESAPAELPPPHPEDILSTIILADFGDHTTYFGKNGVAWVLRFGGLCTLFGAAFARMVPLTKAEKESQAAFSALKALKAEEEEP
jgi:solute carrier family 45 protein 1/2/4